MNITKDKTVAQVVTENMGADHVFSKYNIDFCCGGDITIELACKENGVEFKTLKNEIEAITTLITNDKNFKEMDIISLINYSQKTYHKYIKENIPMVSQLAVKVAEVHWREHKEVVEVNNLFNKVISEIIEQLSNEENIIFPFLEKKIKLENLNVKLNHEELETFENSIKNIEKSYKNTGDIFKRISKLTSNYSLPEGACNTYKLLYEKLQEFELELHKFIHFEKNILFPKVLESNKL